MCVHEHDEEHESEGAEHSRTHLLLMTLCCLIPIIIVAALVFAKMGGTYLPLVVVFLCPFLMLLMFIPSRHPKQRKLEQ